MSAWACVGRGRESGVHYGCFHTKLGELLISRPLIKMRECKQSVDRLNTDILLSSLRARMGKSKRDKDPRVGTLL